MKLLLVLLLLFTPTLNSVLSAAQCAVCFDDIKRRDVVLTCPQSQAHQKINRAAAVHAFHKNCIQQEWMEQNQACPVCKQEWLLFQDKRLLIPVIERGEIALALRLIKNPNRDINERDDDGETPLTVAAWHGYAEVVAALLARKDCQVNHYNNSHGTAFALAATNNHENVLRLLLADERTDVNCLNEDGSTPLIIAAADGEADVVSLLLQRDDVDVNYQDADGDTPLIAASGSGDVETVSLLLCNPRLDAVNAQNKNGDTALTFADMCNHAEVVRVLVADQRVKTDIKNKVGSAARVLALSRPRRR